MAITWSLLYYGYFLPSLKVSLITPSKIHRQKFTMFLLACNTTRAGNHCCVIHLCEQRSLKNICGFSNDNTTTVLFVSELIGHLDRICTSLNPYTQVLWLEKPYFRWEYRQVSDIRGTLVGNWIVHHSDLVGASPLSAAPTTSSFST